MKHAMARPNTMNSSATSPRHRHHSKRLSPEMNRLERFDAYLRSRSGGWLFVEALALAIIIGFLDYLTGYEVSVWPFYSIPILLMLWFGNRRLAVLISVVSAAAWWWADKASGHVYSSEWLRLWDAIVRLMFFCLIIFAGWTFRQQRDAIRARFELLERSHRLEQEIISVSEREQQRIGRDLHDGVCQFLVAIGFTASMLKRELARESHALSKTAGEVANLLQDAARRTRDLARGLSPVDRDEGGLESALRELAASTSKLAGLSCSFVCSGSIQVRDDNQAIHLFRIAQEALANALKHGRAKTIVIALEAGDSVRSLRVSDDGIGLDPNGSEKSGMGLSIMRYRARMIGGALEIEPNTPTGTIVVCTIEKSANAGQSSDPSGHE
jgi:signal transduction histidine kinase